MHCISLIAEDALLIRFNTQPRTSENAANIQLKTNDYTLAAQRVAALVELIQSHYSEYCRDLIPAYASLTVIVDFPKVLPQTFASLISADVKALEINAGHLQTLNEVKAADDSAVITLPCYYGTEVAYDLAELANTKQLSCDAVTALHTKSIYQVYAIGFSPGFPYLGFVDDKISCPRKATPRTRVPAGSVGIADKQTGIYPQETPGGWQIIGRCPLKLFDPFAQNPSEISYLKTGDKVQFEAISRQHYIDLGGDFDTSTPR